MHGIWLKSSHMTTANLQKYSNSHLLDLYLESGGWNTNGTIDYYVSPSQVANFKAMANAINPNFKLHAWLYWAPSPIDLSTSNARQILINNAVSYLNNYPGFDGLNDDLNESFYGSDQNYADFINAIQQALPNKSITADLFAGYGTNIPALYGAINIRKVNPMFYDSKQWGPGNPENPNALEQVKVVLNNSRSPVQLGIMVNFDNNSSPALLQDVLAVLTSYNVAGYAKYEGVALWMEGMFDQGGRQDWAAWNNWVGTAPPPQYTLNISALTI